MKSTLVVGKLDKTCLLDVKIAQNYKIMRPNPVIKFEGSSLLLQNIGQGIHALYSLYPLIMLNWDTVVKAVVPAMLGFQICKTAGYMGLFFIVLTLFENTKQSGRIQSQKGF